MSSIVLLGEVSGLCVLTAWFSLQFMVFSVRGMMTYSLYLG